MVELTDRKQKLPRQSYFLKQIPQNNVGKEGEALKDERTREKRECGKEGINEGCMQE